jgi:CBS domain-containing protein
MNPSPPARRARFENSGLGKLSSGECGLPVALGGEAAMLVKDAMSTHVESVAPDTTAQECARRMRQTEVGALPVWEEGKLIGIVTDRDICCRAVGNGRDPKTVTAREIMTSQISSCFDDQDCGDAARVMKDMHLRRLAVMDRKQKLVGMLSVDDLARYSHDLAGDVLEAAAPWPH